MGCASSVNIQIEENNDNRKLIANGKEVGSIKRNQNEKIGKNPVENKNEDYLDLPTIKQSQNENTDSKILTNSKNLNANNIKINNKYNQSTNFKYLKETKINLIKSNPVIKENKNEEQNQNKYIPLKHPLDLSLEKKNSSLKNLKISEEIEKNDENAKKVNYNNNIDVMNSMEERINNYKRNDHNYNDDEEDGVNIGNYDGDGDNDDMCNFGQSMDFDKMKNKGNENQSQEICVIFEIQSTGVKYNINIRENVKLNELIELFKKKIKLSSFEKPEFVFNEVFLVDFEKPISDYKIKDNSKIVVFI